MLLGDVHATFYIVLAHHGKVNPLKKYLGFLLVQKAFLSFVNFVEKHDAEGVSFI